MADEPDPVLRVVIRAAYIVEQLIGEIRPVARDRKARIVSVSLDTADLVIVREFGKDRAIRRGRKAVRMREMDDVLQACLSYSVFWVI